MPNKTTKKQKYDFSGYVTKFNIPCSDGRIIRKDAFTHQDGERMPLVWQHSYDGPENVLGYVDLEVRDDGVYGYASFNDTASAENTKQLVKHGDIDSLSIHARQLKQEGPNVIFGNMKEVSVVLSRANPEALIDNVMIHSEDGYKEDLTTAVIFNDSKISLTELTHADKGDETIQDVFDTLSEKQKDVVYAMIGTAVDSVSHADDSEGTTFDEETKDDAPDESADKQLNHSDEGGETDMKKNVFDKKGTEKQDNKTLTHSDIKAIFTDAQKCGSLKEAVLTHAGTYGIDNISYLFPDARNVTKTPELITRDLGWVGEFKNGLKKVPFSRIKTLHADLTEDDARAKGYVTGNLKVEEVFGLLKRTTTPTTIYKKQKLDRDDILDITDMDVVAWLKAEMRIMLDEEIARAVLVGDGRSALSDDKVSETNIRPIYTDADLYSHKVQMAVDVTPEEIVEEVFTARSEYKGTGRPTLYLTAETLTDLLLIKDTTGHRIYKTEEELAKAMRVKKVVEVEAMEGYSRDVGGVDYDLVAIAVNPADYCVGADKGGKVEMFDDFDIDYNQYKYLIEGRMSGALIKAKSAIVFEKVQAAG